MATPKFVMPPTWGQLGREQQEAMQEVFGGVTLAFTEKCYEEQRAKIQEHNDAIARGMRSRVTLKPDGTVSIEEATIENERPMIGIIPQTGEAVYRDTDGSLTTQPMTDIELSAQISERLDWIEEEMTRMQVALVRRARGQNPRTKPGLFSMQARRQLQESLRVLHDAARALGETPGARAQARAEAELAHVWGRAKDKYQRWAGAQRKSPLESIPLWQGLTEQQKAEWFALADDRVPRTWKDLTPAERGTYRDEHDIRPLPADEAAAHHERNRLRSLRRRAYRQIEHANPYTVHGPEQRMSDVASLAQTLSWARDQHARGITNDLEIAIWEEHYRRALHAYTKPFEPYPVP